MLLGADPFRFLSGQLTALLFRSSAAPVETARGLAGAFPIDSVPSRCQSIQLRSSLCFTFAQPLMSLLIRCVSTPVDAMPQLCPFSPCAAVALPVSSVQVLRLSAPLYSSPRLCHSALVCSQSLRCHSAPFGSRPLLTVAMPRPSMRVHAQPKQINSGQPNAYAYHR